MRVRTAPAEDQASHRNSVYNAAKKPGAGNSFFVDFGKEFQGGLRLHVKGGKAGQTVKLQSGEMCTPMLNNNSHSCNKVAQDWGWDFTWTLREGDQTIEQHEYMEFRYVSEG